MRHSLLVVSWMVLGLGFSAASVAQTTNAATEQRLNALEARIAALERKQAQPPAPAAAGAAAAGAAQPAMAAAPAPVAAPRVVRAQPTAADFDELHRGMTISQVVKLLGKPGDTRVLPTSSTYYYPDTHGRSVEFDRDSRVIQWSQP